MTHNHPKASGLLVLLTSMIALGTTLGCAEDPEANLPLTIERVSPGDAQQGELIRLFGVFGQEPEEVTGYVNGVCTVVTGWSDTQVTVLVPRGAGVGKRLVVLKGDGEVSNAGTVNIVGPAFPPDRVYCDESTGGGG